jgi:hypothetical protein
MCVQRDTHLCESFFSDPFSYSLDSQCVQPEAVFARGHDLLRDSGVSRRESKSAAASEGQWRAFDKTKLARASRGAGRGRAG